MPSNRQRLKPRKIHSNCKVKSLGEVIMRIRAGEYPAHLSRSIGAHRSLISRVASHHVPKQYREALRIGHLARMRAARKSHDLGDNLTVTHHSGLHAQAHWPDDREVQTAVRRLRLTWYAKASKKKKE